MEIKIEILSVTTPKNEIIVCLLISDVITNMHSEIVTDYIDYKSHGRIVAMNSLDDVGFSPLDILYLARILGLEIP